MPFGYVQKLGHLQKPSKTYLQVREMEWLGGMQKFFSRPQNPDFTKNIISHPGSTGKKKKKLFTVPRHLPALSTMSKEQVSEDVVSLERTRFRATGKRRYFFGGCCNCVLQMAAMDPNHSKASPHPWGKGGMIYPHMKEVVSTFIWFCFGKWGYQNVV
jgi:hypothetical protein